MMTVTVATLATVVKARKVILKAMMWKVIASLTKKESFTGADPGFFLGGGAPVRNDVTDGEVTKF